MDKNKWTKIIKEYAFVFKRTVLRTIEVYTKHEMDVYSGYTTFYLLMSVVPLLMMIISLVNMLPWFSVEQVSDILTKMIPDIPQVRVTLLSVILNVNRQSGQLITYIFLFTSLWSGSHGINAMMVGLDKINHTRISVLKERPKAIFYTIIFTFLIPSMVIFQMLRSWVENGIDYFFSVLSLDYLADMINRALNLSEIITFIVTWFVILLTFTFLPSGKRKVRTQIPGAVFTCILWAVFTNAFGFFIKKFWKLSRVYGILAAVFLAAMWMKFIVTILFYGASLNRALQVKISRDCST